MAETSVTRLLGVPPNMGEVTRDYRSVGGGAPDSYPAPPGAGQRPAPNPGAEPDSTGSPRDMVTRAPATI
jgi:hypothetical protein